MAERHLSLGLDTSTQSMSAAVLDIDSGDLVLTHQVDYLKDERMVGWGIRRSDYVVPPRIKGEADQPPELFYASLEAVLEDIKQAGIPIADIAVINHSGQQHGHVYLNGDAYEIFSSLNSPETRRKQLTEQLCGALAYGTAPTWMTSDTQKQADAARDFVGGKEHMIRLSGSNAPLRFTGAVIRRVAERFPEAYAETDNIQLISSLIPAILAANSRVPFDYGNACGTSLMDYKTRQWSDTLLEAHAHGLPGGKDAFRKKLPQIVAPYTIIGSIARYFVNRYGFRPSCRIVVGSGDNPQSKVLVAGDLLSLGTSFVNMVSTDGTTLDMSGCANAMYDGIGRPFIFGCRTNGAMVWDQLRASYGLRKDEYQPAEDKLENLDLARQMVFWQPMNESLPCSKSFDLVRLSHSEPELGADYAGLINTTLAAVYQHSKSFTRVTDEPLYVTGGANNSPAIMRIVAAIWKRPVVALNKAGAASGAAVAGAYALAKERGEELDVEDFGNKLLKKREPIAPREDDIAAYHGRDGFLERFAAEEARLLSA